jgi:hypothetical protein
VTNKFRPTHLVAEEVSGSVYRSGPRTQFDSLFQDLEAERVLDPLAAKPVKRIACFMLDRFTRDPDEGGDWLRMMRRAGVDLHETHYDDPPQPLHQIEHLIRDAWNRAAKEVERDRERVMNALLELAQAGKPTYGIARMFGHKAVLDANGKTVGYKVLPKEAAAIRHGVEMILAGGSPHGFLLWLNENGHNNAAGTPFTYGQVRNLLAATRLAGLVRLRLDRTRIHREEAYEGELFPKELIHEKGESPPAGFKPPIEQIIDYPTWMQLQKVIEGRSRKVGPHEKFFASTYVTCDVCGGPIVGGKGQSGSHYRCPKRHLNGRSRSQADRLRKISHDGERHPTLNTSWLDYLIEEVLFACIERDPDPTSAPPLLDLAAERGSLNAALRELDERLGNANFLLVENRIPRAQYGKWAEEIDAERSTLRGRLQELAVSEPLERLPEGVTLRELWPGLTMDERRAWIPIVFEAIVLRSTRKAKGLAERVKFSFREGYEPPEGELEELLQELVANLKQRNPENRTARAIQERVFTLHKQGKSIYEIQKALVTEGFQSHKGKVIGINVVRTLARRACSEAGVEYIINQRDRALYPFETRELIVGLSERLGNQALVARELNRLGMRRLDGGEWTSQSIYGVVKTHAKNLGRGLPNPAVETRGGRPAKLNDQMREVIWQMKREEQMSLSEIGNWLKDRGIKTPSGGEEWANATILDNIRVIDRKKAAKKAEEIATADQRTKPAKRAKRRRNEKTAEAKRPADRSGTRDGAATGKVPARSSPAAKREKRAA